MSSNLLPRHEPESVRRYCRTKDCDTMWRGADGCPTCGDEGQAGSNGHEPEGWPILTASALGREAVEPRRTT